MTLLGIVLVSATSVVIEPLLNLFPARYFDDIARAVGSGGWAIVVSVIVAPVLEELIFRGLILRWLSRRWRPFWAVLVSALAFGLVHLPNLPQVVNATVMGVVLGYIYVLCRSVWPVIIIHAVNNALAYLLLQVLGVGATDLQEIVANNTIYWVIYGVNAAIFVFSMTLIIKRAKIRSLEI